MSEYEKIRKHAEERGWTYESAAGDHMKFYPPPELGRNGYVVVSVSVNSNNRSFKNSVSEFRKFDKGFMRTQGKTKPPAPEAAAAHAEPAPDTEQSLQIPNTNFMKPEDKTIYKKYSWLQVGTKVRTRSGKGQKSPYTVMEIHSPDGKRVWDESDIVILKDAPEKEHMAGDLDAWETRKCQACGRDLPVNHFNLNAKGARKKFTCLGCMEKEKTASSAQGKPELSAPDPMTLFRELMDGMPPDARIRILSFFDVRDLLTAMDLRGLKTDIKSFSDGDILEEVRRRGLESRPEESAPDTGSLSASELYEELMTEARHRGKLPEQSSGGPVEHAVPDIGEFSDGELYNELKSRGWEGRLTRTQTLE